MKVQVPEPKYKKKDVGRRVQLNTEYNIIDDTFEMPLRMQVRNESLLKRTQEQKLL